MNKIKRKIAWDDNGASSPLFQFLILIIIVLGVWHFGAPYLGINSWLGYLDEYTREEEPAVITFSWSVYDRITMSNVALDTIANMDHSIGTALYDVWNNRVEADFTDDTLGWNIASSSEIDRYDIQITTNAPSSIFGPYWHVSITGSENPYAFWSGGYQYITHEFKDWDIKSGSGDKTFSYQLDPENAVVSHVLGEWTYYVITITDNEGLIKFQDNVFMW